MTEFLNTIAGILCRIFSKLRIIYRYLGLLSNHEQLAEAAIKEKSRMNPKFAIFTLTILVLSGSFLVSPCVADSDTPHLSRKTYDVKGVIHKAYAVEAPAPHLLPEGFRDEYQTEGGYHMVIILSISEPPAGCPVAKGGYTLITPRGDFPNPWPHFKKLRSRIGVTVRIFETDVKGVYKFILHDTIEKPLQFLVTGPYFQMLPQD